jgi:hypothetical protein
MCFQCMILVCKMYKLWMNEFCTIFISKSGDDKFLMGQPKLLSSKTCWPTNIHIVYGFCLDRKVKENDFSYHLPKFENSTKNSRIQ